MLILEDLQDLLTLPVVEKHFIPVTSRKMRELARLLIKIRKRAPGVRKLLEALQPQNYDLIVEATKSASRYNEEKECFESPTYAIRICKSLKDCCSITVTYALKNKDIYSIVSSTESEAKLRTMIQLIESNWFFDVGGQAANNLNIKKSNKVTIIPFASDLKTFQQYLGRKSSDAATKLDLDPNDEDAYKVLLETVFCRVLLLNRRRPGELQRLKISAYVDGDSRQNYEEFSDAVSPAEKNLMKKFKRIVIRGKRGRGVPVLFSEDIQQHISLLLSTRPNFFGNVVNHYLFAKPTTPIP